MAATVLGLDLMRLVFVCESKRIHHQQRFGTSGVHCPQRCIAQAADMREKTTHNSYDNITALFWQRKGATTTLGLAAFLLRLQALHQRYYRYVPLCDYIPGPINAMADFFCDDGI